MASLFSSIETWFQHAQFTRRLQLSFLEDLVSLISNGVSVTAAIETIREVSEGATKQVATHIGYQLAAGKLLADGMQDWFARPLVEIIRAGENSGTLQQSLEAAIETYSQRRNATSSLINSLVYPFIVLALAMVMVVFIKHSVLMSFAKIKPVSVWPGVGKTLFSMGYFIQYWWWLFVLIVILLIIGIVMMLHRFTGKGRELIDRAPLLSLYRSSAAAQFMESLGLLITNGIVLKKALGILQRDAAPYLAWHLLKMELRLSGGQDNIADVLDTALIDRADLARLRVVAKGKGFEHALITLGRRSYERNMKAIALTGRILGGIVLVAGAMMAATMVFGIYSVGSVIAT